MRYSLNPRIGLKVLNEWGNLHYKALMLAFMGLELLLLVVLVVVEVVGLWR